MTENTKVIPIVRIYKAFPVNSPIHAAKPPKDKEPVSPINTRAGDTLNNKYADSAPPKQKAIVDKLPSPFCKNIKTPKARKNGIHADAAKPSSPSVRLTALTVAKNKKMTSGIIQYLQ